MTIVTYRRKKTNTEKPRRLPRQQYKGPTEKWCKPRLIYSLDGKAILTTSKWYKNPHTCIFDWLQRGFMVIEETENGGGFDFKDFPKLDDLQSRAEKFYVKWNMEQHNDN